MIREASRAGRRAGPMRPAFGAIGGLTALLGMAAFATLAVVLVPVVLIRPFSPQTPATVATAYALRSVSPLFAPVGAALTALLGVLVLHGRPRTRVARLATVLGTAVVVVATAAAAWFSHQNHFEWMFAPLANARFERAVDAAFVEASDMVVAIEVNGDAVAYPVRQMAYHHLYNDEVGTLPVVSTY